MSPTLESVEEQRRRAGKGQVRPGHPHRGRIRIVCDIDPEDFAAIEAADLPGCRSMAARIRLLLEWGLMALEVKEDLI